MSKPTGFPQVASPLTKPPEGGCQCGGASGSMGGGVKPTGAAPTGMRPFNDAIPYAPNPRQSFGSGSMQVARPMPQGMPTLFGGGPNDGYRAPQGSLMDLVRQTGMFS
jgi:hypothetical protein